VLPPERAWAYDPEIEYAIERADDVVPRSRPGLALELELSLFETRPSSVRSDLEPERRRLYGREVVALSADSELSFDVGAGRRRVRGLFAASEGDDADDWTAGLVFAAVVSTPGAPDAVLFERRVDPRGMAADRRLFAFDTTLELAAPSTIRMRSRPEPGAEGRLACWSGIAVE
jgi:hypothetical protein